MKKEIIIGGLFVLSLLLMFGFVFADDPDPYELAQNHTGIQTSNGTLDLSAGTLVGGDPTNYITLTENTVMQTTEGEKTFQNGTKIDCNPPPGYPNPCEASHNP